MSLKRSSPSTSLGTPNKKSKVEVFTINDTNRDYQDPKADITLIASDGLRFKVHSYVLKTASVVFRDMLEIDDITNREINLTDKTIESSLVLALFLNICHGKPISMNSDYSSFQLLKYLVKFATKYDAEPTIQYITVSSYKWHHQKALSTHSVFRLGCTLDNPEMVAFAIRNSKDRVWVDTTNRTDEEITKAKNPVASLGFVIGACCVYPGSWSWEDFKSIPEAYVFGMLRALAHGGKDQDKIADGFLQIMKAMGKTE